MAASKKVIAIDLGGTNMRVALVQGKRVLKYVRNPTPKSKDTLLKVMKESIASLMTEGVVGIGVGSPGPLKDGVIKNPPNLPFRNFNLKKYLHKAFRMKVEVANDADCVALAELVYGVKKDNFVILTLGTGIGGGIIINKKLYRGEGSAGELGHMIIDDGHDIETAWKESRQKCKQYFGRDMLIRDLLKSNEKRAREILRDASEALGYGISSILVAFDPKVVVLMGGARETGKQFIDMIRKVAWSHSMIQRKTPIVWSKLSHPGILGASLLVLPKAKELMG